MSEEFPLEGGDRRFQALIDPMVLSHSRGLSGSLRQQAEFHFRSFYGRRELGQCNDCKSLNVQVTEEASSHKHRVVAKCSSGYCHQKPRVTMTPPVSASFNWPESDKFGMNPDLERQLKEFRDRLSNTELPSMKEFLEKRDIDDPAVFFKTNQGSRPPYSGKKVEGYISDKVEEYIPDEFDLIDGYGDFA